MIVLLVSWKHRIFCRFVYVRQGCYVICDMQSGIFVWFQTHR
jgi:hypothetical protein